MATTLPQSAAPAAPASGIDNAHKRVIFASSLGTVFEWYDFYLYGSLAAIISKQFFAGGYVEEGRQVLADLLSVVGLSLPRRPGWILWSMRFYRSLIALRGTKFRERSESEIPPKELLRVDVCEAVGATVAVDPLFARSFRTKALWYALRAGDLPQARVAC